MNIEHHYESGCVTISVCGRVDSTATTLLHDGIATSLEACDGEITSIVINASEMTYISSTGLRVFLQLRQKYENLRITECNAEVFNVFEMTGFHNIIKVEKALPKLSLEGIEPLAGFRNIYPLTDETMVKVFSPKKRKEDVERLVQLSKEMFVLGIPTLMTFDIVTVGDCLGLVFERFTPTEIDATGIGSLLRALHDHIIEPGGIIPSVKDMERKRIESLAPYLGEEAVNKLLKMLNVVPDGSALLHGNLTLHKAAFRDGQPVMLDMGTLCYGNPVFDLSHLYYVLPEEEKKEFFDEVLASYYGVESEDTMERQRQNITVISLIHHFTALTKGGVPDDNKVEEMRGEFQSMVMDKWDEILSALHFKMDFGEEMRRLERERFYLDGDVNIDWVANALGTNRHYVSDYFNKVLHMTFNDYLNGLRLDYAVELLRSGRVPQSQIPYSVGFNNDHTFRRLFKQRFGCTPSKMDIKE